MRFIELKSKAESAGLVAVQCTAWHWQIRGGIAIVNYYPGKGTIYINGAECKSRERAHRADDLIQFAIEGPDYQRRTTRDPDGWDKKAAKQRLFHRSRCCCWCGTRFDSVKAATIEHIVPLARGGSNRDDNLRLSCEPCNKARGDSYATPAKQTT